jgi:TRAP transporter TAXI family solute receptor
MEPDRVQKIAIMAGVAAVLAALATRRLPRWLRITLVSSLAALACAAGLLGYRYATHPVMLTIATGSIDGDATRLMSAVAAQMAAKESPVRLRVIDKGTALDAINAFAAGDTDLAIVRPDVGDLAAARTVVVMTYAVVLITVPPGSTIDSMDGLKGKTVGVIAGPVNQKLTAAIVKAYDLDRAKVIFKDISSPSDALQALQSKQIHALLVVMPISEKYLGMLRDVLPRSAKMKLGLVPIDLAGAIAATARTYESYDLPKGTIRGSPAIPDEDLTTLRVPFYLVANKKLADNVVAALTQTMMEVPRDLVGEYPLLAQIGAPSSDKDAYIPIHPGAAIYFNGEQQSFLDKYADKLFYLFMLLGFFASMLAAAWKFMTKDADGAEDAPLTRLTRLMDQIGTAKSESELANAERNIDEILKAQLEKYSRGEAEAAECAALGLAIQRLERLIGQRRAGLGSRPRAAV